MSRRRLPPCFCAPRALPRGGAGMVASFPGRPARLRRCSRFGTFWRRAASVLRKLPPKPLRNKAEQAAADALLRPRAPLANCSSRFTSTMSTTADQSRLDVPSARRPRLRRGKAPGPGADPAEVAAEAPHPQRDKDGVEIDQGMFLAHVCRARGRRASLSCDAAAAAGDREARRRIRLERRARSRRSAARGAARPSIST